SRSFGARWSAGRHRTRGGRSGGEVQVRDGLLGSLAQLVVRTPQGGQGGHSARIRGQTRAIIGRKHQLPPDVGTLPPPPPLAPASAARQSRPRPPRGQNGLSQMEASANQPVKLTHGPRTPPRAPDAWRAPPFESWRRAR